MPEQGQRPGRAGRIDEPRDREGWARRDVKVDPGGGVGPSDQVVRPVADGDGLPHAVVEGLDRRAAALRQGNRRRCGHMSRGERGRRRGGSDRHSPWERARRGRPPARGRPGPPSRRARRGRRPTGRRPRRRRARGVAVGAPPRRIPMTARGGTGRRRPPETARTDPGARRARSRRRARRRQPLGVRSASSRLLPHSHVFRKHVTRPGKRTAQPTTTSSTTDQ